MNPVSEDVKDVLVAASQGTFALASDGSGWGIYINSEPTLPDQAITIYDTGGPKPGYYMNKALNPTRFDTITIRARSTTYLAAYAKLLSITKTLDTNGSFNTTDDPIVHYSDILATSEILFLRKDEDDRFIWMINYQAYREERNS